MSAMISRQTPQASPATQSSVQTRARAIAAGHPDPEMRLILLDIAASGVENPKKALLVLDKHTKTRELIMLKEKYAVATTTHLEIRQKLSALVHDILAKYQEISDLKDDEDRLPKMDKLSDETENLIKETELWKEKAAETDEEVKGLEAEMDKYEQELEKLKEKFEELFGDSNLE